MDTLVLKIRNGDSEYKLDLINKVKPLILSYIKKFNLFMDCDDIWQESIELLFNCIYSFDINKNVPFIAYYQKSLYYYHLDRSKEDEELISLDTTTVTDEEIPLIETVPSNEIPIVEQVLINDKNNRLYDCISQLSLKQQWLLHEHFYLEKSLIQISHESGKHYQTLVKLKARALDKLKDKLLS